MGYIYFMLHLIQNDCIMSFLLSIVIMKMMEWLGVILLRMVLLTLIMTIVLVIQIDINVESINEGFCVYSITTPCFF